MESIYTFLMIEWLSLSAATTQLKAGTPQGCYLRNEAEITSHFKRRCIPPNCVAKAQEYPDIPALSRLAGRANLFLCEPLIVHPFYIMYKLYLFNS